MGESVKSDFEKARTGTGILLPYQQAWVADDRAVKIIEKGRRIGISWAEAADDVLYASVKGRGEKHNVWYIGYTKDMALEYINDCANWARAYNLAASAMEEIEIDDEEDYCEAVREKKILSYQIKFESGWRITALSSRPTNLRGKQGRVILDEAAFHEDLSGLLKAALAHLIWGGEVKVISTHNGDANEFNLLVQDVRAGKKNYGLHRVTFDDALRQGLYRRICAVLKRDWSPEAEKAWRQEVIDFYGEDADEELFCVPSQGSGVYLTRSIIEGCMSKDIPVIRYEQKSSFSELPDTVRTEEVKDWCEENLAPILKTMDKGRATYFGEDFGRSGDLTVIMPLQELQNASFRAPFVLELRNVPFQQQEQILYFIVDRLPRFRGGAMDARGNGEYLAERAMQKYGASRISQVMLSENWYRENMPAYKVAFEDKNILLPKDADIIEDHRAFKVVRGVARLPEGRTSGRDSKQRHGDSGIAGVLAWHATREMRGGPVEYRAVSHRQFAQAGAF